ncbi:acylcarnitine hydrolase-like isoform X2 [Ceratina calcarata]|uniref:Carboxylic ester hydrolase n=1 Tax=Ceratina calcarata TaxID=156304 RepID=A0AAJ7RX57_9HYME|nr:acylcarnitine hydrolase-like isoform X1 [Ceratina calcarata]XP_026666923.1 acylcarnitine hydrolase-like isoform X2 [Ceratina calcarata]
MKGTVLLVFLFLVSVECSDVRRSAVVQTKSGPVQGAILKTVWNSIEYSSFKGIPFAAPPIGDLRFRPPVAPEPWDHVRDAVEEASQCPQLDNNGAYNGNEDCLYLSVFTPKTKFDDKSALKPVMSWIYGGTFLKGCANSSEFGPDFFIEQDVVVVTSNYRLGALGFLYLDHPHAAGNAGMKDQLAVLKWIRENIAKFGGDPNRVTIFGQSAGSSSVSLHVLSDESKGLFHQAICQSGTSLSYLYKSREDSLTVSNALATKLGFLSLDKEQLIKSFLHADPKDLVEQTSKLPMIVSFAPIRDNSYNDEPPFLSECPVTKVATGNYNKVPMIMGFTHDELLLFTEKPYEILNKSEKYLKELYPILPPSLKHPYETVKQAAVGLSAIGMKAQVDFAQKMFTHENGDNPIYYYQLSYVSNYAEHKSYGIPVSGVAHQDDVGYIFNVEWLHAPTDPKHPFNQFRHKLVTMWANFAKYGNPTPVNANPLGDTIWENSGKEGRLLNITDVSKMINRSEAISQTAVIAENVLYLTLPVTSSCKKISYVNYFDLF